MAVTRQIAPTAVADLMLHTLERLDGDVRSFDHSFREMSEPLPLYCVNTELLDQHASARDRRIAALLTQIGWRSVVTTQGGEPSLADVKAKDDELRFARVVSGERVSAMISAAAACDGFADDADYELRIVESPSLKIAAIWLAGETPLFMPFAGLPQAPISETEFIRALTARAAGDTHHPSGLAGFLGAGLVFGAFAVLAAVVKGLAGGNSTARKPLATTGEDEDD